MDEKRGKKSREKAIRALFKVEKALQNRSLKLAKDDFLERFTKCELLYKSLLLDYKMEKNQDIAEEKMVINMTVVPAVMKNAGLSMSKETLLEPLFSSKDSYKKRGTKSAKLLRNGIVHKLSIEDMEEVLLRVEYFAQLMNTFTETIRPKPS